ncbi:hypothetical protein JCGZ_18862 [Jatropha curcas]|uniref:Uncharacterized protein n=2 Tax=Jatropha curcas TaxID=180498 RepID=A0A067JV80_JATCU|nr:hypothetical protein JCGZ_18862 [Jatropha curcas]
MRVGHAMVKDQQKGQKDLYKEKGKVDVLRASYSSQRQQGFLSSSVKKSSIRGGNLVLQKIDALLPEKTEFLCQRERNFNFGCVKKRSMLKGSGLVDARTDYDLNCANLVNRSQNLEQNQSRLSNYLGTQHVQVDGGTATHSNSRLWREVLVTGSDAVDKRQKELRRTHEYLTTEKVVVANKIRKTKQESKLESEMEHLHEHLEITHNEALCRPEICANIRWEVSQSDAEKISFEELKNLSELMSLSTKKKIRKEKSLKSQGTNAKDIDVTMGEKPTKSSLEKPETLKRVAKPSVLLIQFPPQSILPSVSELKARFARFGPFEHPPRVFWKSSTCRVIFKYESDAQVARRYAVQKASLFGDVKVLYDVEVLQVPAPALPKSSKQSLEATSSKIPQLTSISTSYSTESRSTAPGKQHLPAVHSKSCLKNAQADEEFFTKGVGGNLHVNFMCSGDGNHGDEQPAVNRVVQSDYHPNITSSSSQGTHDDNENNLKKVVLPLPPWLPHSYWISNLDLQIC